MENKQNIQVIDNLYNAFATGDMQTILGQIKTRSAKFVTSQNNISIGNQQKLSPFHTEKVMRQGYRKRLSNVGKFYGLDISGST